MVWELVGEISAASSGQTGVEQINRAMAEMDKVVQEKAVPEQRRVLALKSKDI